MPSARSPPPAGWSFPENQRLSGAVPPSVPGPALVTVVFMFTNWRMGFPGTRAPRDRCRHGAVFRLAAGRTMIARR